MCILYYSARPRLPQFTRVTITYILHVYIHIKYIIVPRHEPPLMPTERAAEADRCIDQTLGRVASKDGCVLCPALLSLL